MSRRANIVRIWLPCQGGSAVACGTPRLVRAGPPDLAHQVGPLCLSLLWAPCRNRVHTGCCFQRTVPQSGICRLFLSLVIYHLQAYHPRLLYYTFYCQAHLCV